MKKKPPVKLLFESFFYEEDCQAVCLSWIGKVPALDIICTATAANNFIWQSMRGVSVQSMTPYGSLTFDAHFRSNRLLFTELMVAIERSIRSPSLKHHSFSMFQTPYSSDHDAAKPIIPPGTRLQPTEVAASIKELTGRTIESGTLEKAANREVRRRLRTDAHWAGIYANEQKQPLFSPDYAGEPEAQVAERAVRAGETSDPKRKKQEPRNHSLTQVRALIDRARRLNEKEEYHLRQVIERINQLRETNQPK